MKITKLLICIFPILFLYNCSKKSDDLLNLILDHQNKYPQMEVQDVYKLLYQSVFGVKHLLKDTAMSHQYLIEEFNSVESRNEPLFEDISLKNNVVRVNLKSFKYKNLSLEKLFEVMKLSAEKINGDPKEFRKYWSDFENMAQNKLLKFNQDEIKKIKEKITGIPTEMHHSDIYTNSYSPNYRVVKKEIFLKYFPDEN